MTAYDSTVDKEKNSPSFQPNEQSAPAIQCKGYEARTSYPLPPVQRKENNTGLPDKLKAGVENLSGYSMDDVHVHYNSDKPALLQALAYAQGTDIHIAPGQEEHLPHEAWHVAQQKQGRVRPTIQLKQNVPVNNNAGLEHEADVMGRKAADSSQSSDSQTQLKKSSTISSSNAPIQGRFGFEIELPMLFLHKGVVNVPSTSGGAATRMRRVPMDASMAAAGATDVHNGPDCHVNVDHSSTLNPLFDAELKKYAADRRLDDTEKDNLMAHKGRLIPHGASIVEVVTDAWDETTLHRAQALDKISDVIEWIASLYDSIEGDSQARLGAYFIGSNTPYSSMFQPRLGYFHSTYGVKLSKVPQAFRETTRQKNNLKNYAKRNQPQTEHANNVQQTFNSIAVANTALKAIKKVWPRTGGNIFKKGTKGWNTNTEGIFLGFLTALANYLIMFRVGNGANLAKQRVGMHYYKSDLYDVAQALPAEVITTLRGNAGLLISTIAAIGRATGFGVNTSLGGPMDDVTLNQYLHQIFTGNSGVQSVVNGGNIYDPLLSRSINPYSRKLGPDLLGPADNQERGIVIENRHLEYLNPNYGRDTEESEAQWHQEAITYAPPKMPGDADLRTDEDKAMYDSIRAREAGPAKRPIGEWEGIMIGIYDMVKRLNG